jgi:hypothetical protein
MLSHWEDLDGKSVNEVIENGYVVIITDNTMLIYNPDSRECIRWSELHPNMQRVITAMTGITADQIIDILPGAFI